MKAVDLPYKGGPSVRTVMLPENDKEGAMTDQELLEELAANPQHDEKLPEYILKGVVAHREKTKAPEVKAEVVEQPVEEPKKYGKKSKKEEIE